MSDDLTTIAVKPSTRDRLQQIALKSESYDDLLNDMMDFLKEHDYLLKKIKENASEE